MDKIRILDNSGQKKTISFEELKTLLEQGENFSVISSPASNKHKSSAAEQEPQPEHGSAAYFQPAQQEKLKRLYLPPHHYETAFATLLSRISAHHGFREAKKLKLLISSGRFLPHQNILKNKHPFSDHYCSVEDDLGSIFDRLKEMAVNFQNVISSSVNFSKLRPKMSLIKSTQGFSAGPVSFVRVFSSTLEALRQNQTPELIPEQSFLLSIQHPDILEYLIFIKNFQKNNLNRNIRFLIEITPSFLEALANDGDFELINPANNQAVNLLSAKNTFDLIVSTILENPQLGLVRAGSTPNDQLLVTGLLNLAAYPAETLETELSNDLTAVRRFLQLQAQQESKKTGAPVSVKINFCGWAELLIEMKTAYDSLTAIELAEKIFALARKTVGPGVRLGTDLHSPLMAALSAGKGFEALEQLVTTRSSLEGQEVYQAHWLLKRKLDQHGLTAPELLKNIADHNSLQEIYQLPTALKPLFRTGSEIDHRFHLEFQRKIEEAAGNECIEKKIYFNNPLDQEKIKNAIIEHLGRSQGILGFFQFGQISQPGGEKENQPGHNFLSTINRQRRQRHREIQPPLFQIKKTEEITLPPISTGT